jgi:hypothetical protein
MAYYRHLFCCSKTKIEGDVAITFSVATKKKEKKTKVVIAFFAALQQNKKKKTTTSWLSLTSLLQ